MHALTLWIINLYVLPNTQATFVNAYKFLKKNALDNAVLTESDFNPVLSENTTIKQEEKTATTEEKKDIE